MNKFEEEDMGLENKKIKPKKQKTYKKIEQSTKKEKPIEEKPVGKIEEKVEEPIKKEQQKNAVVKKGKVNHLLNFREGPGFTFSNVKEYPLLSVNDQVIILKTVNNQWYKIQVVKNNIEGYVNSPYIDII